MEVNIEGFLADPQSLDESALALLGSHGRRKLVEEAKRRIDEFVRSDPPSALPFAELLGRVSDPEPEVAAVIYRGRATAFHSNGRSNEALEAYLEALAVYQSEGNELEVARVLRSLVDVYQLAGQPEESLRRAEEAREILERLGEERVLAQLETNVGNVYVRLDDYPRARESYLAACARFERIRRPLELAISRYNLAIVESQSGMFADAEQTFQAARGVFASEGMDVHVADCVYMLSLVQSRRGSFEEAIAGLEEARRMYALYRKPRGMPLCNLDLAEIYLRLDARREAATHAERAANGFRELSLDYERAKAETILGVANLRLQDPGIATKAFAEARSIFERLNNPAWAAIVDVHRSEVHVLHGEMETAVAILRDAHKTLEAKGLVLWTALAATALARTLVLSARAEEAEAELSALISDRTAHHALDAIVLSQAHRVLADLKFDAGDRSAAIAELELVIETVEGVLGELPRSDIRIAFFRSPHGAYVDLAYLRAVHDGDPSASLQLLESGRFRSWSAKRSSPKGLTPAHQRLAWYFTRRLDSDVGAAGGEEELSGTGGDEAKLREAESDVLLQREKTQVASFELEELRKAVRPGETLLAYALSKFGALAYVFTTESLEVVELDLNLEEVARLRRRWFFHVGKLRFGERYSKRNEQHLAASSNAVLETLGKRLLAPVLEHLGTRNLLVVPYGPLHGLPFHAFRGGESTLADDYDITYGLSVGHIAGTRERTSESDRVLICRSHATDLPALGDEANNLSQLYSERSTLVPEGELHGLLGGRQRSGGLLHLACHGVFRPDNPVMSALLIGDTMLTSRELGKLKLDFDLVTLSGCETGRAQVSGGEEAFGLAHSFIRRGARSVLCSLWPVDDESSSLFMGTFYERLAAGEEARSALAASQREARALNPSATSWGSFVLLGAPDTHFPATGSKL